MGERGIGYYKDVAAMYRAAPKTKGNEFVVETKRKAPGPTSKRQRCVFDSWRGDARADRSMLAARVRE
eukprot:2477758-Prorocentrum_lima.AAC.1